LQSPVRDSLLCIAPPGLLFSWLLTQRSRAGLNILRLRRWIQWPF
jgi:hypothetical protein